MFLHYKHFSPFLSKIMSLSVSSNILHKCSIALLTYVSFSFCFSNNHWIIESLLLYWVGKDSTTGPAASSALNNPSSCSLGSFYDMQSKPQHKELSFRSEKVCLCRQFPSEETRESNIKSKDKAKWRKSFCFIKIVNLPHFYIPINDISNTLG